MKKVTGSILMITMVFTSYTVKANKDEEALFRKIDRIMVYPSELSTNEKELVIMSFSLDNDNQIKINYVGASNNYIKSYVLQKLRSIDFKNYSIAQGKELNFRIQFIK